MEEKTEIKSPEIVYEKDSKDGTRKWVLSVGEGDLVEISTPAGVKNFEIKDVKYI